MADSAALFERYSGYYDELNRDKDYAGEVDYVVTLLGRHGHACGELLEFGSGTGRHGSLLAERGYRVDGVERSASMLALAKASPRFQVHLGDARTIRMGRTFDAVLALFHVVNYQMLNADVRAFFDSAALHLAPKGLFVFDTWYSPAVIALGPQPRSKRVQNQLHALTRSAHPVSHPNENRVDVEYALNVEDTSGRIVETFKEVHSMRHFSLPELDLFGDLSGFERVSAEAYLTGQTPGPDTWGVCLVYRKR